ncbi:hypothetical protein TNCV_3962411 [Trichonephila clavipes]|nr:hypothetical protein TNCV_3962411 [Trichonephila clavipes]
MRSAPPASSDDRYASLQETILPRSNSENGHRCLPRGTMNSLCKRLWRMCSEEVGEKGLLESRSPTIPDRLVWKGQVEDRFGGSRLEADGISVLCI